MRGGTRVRHLLGLGLGLCLAIGLGGCGGDSGASGTAKSERSSSPRSAASDAAGAAAEALATKQPKRPTKPLHEPTRGPAGGQQDVLSNLPGNRSGECTPVGKERDVRSGNLGAGPFDEARASFSVKSRSSRKVDLYFIPTHAKKLTGVTVTARNAVTGASLTKKSKTIGDADQWKFYRLQLDLPEAGTWVLRAAAGQDAGCWVVNL